MVYVVLSTVNITRWKWRSFLHQQGKLVFCVQFTKHRDGSLDFRFSQGKKVDDFVPSIFAGWPLSSSMSTYEVRAYVKLSCLQSSLRCLPTVTAPFHSQNKTWRRLERCCLSSFLSSHCFVSHVIDVNTLPIVRMISPTALNMFAPSPASSEDIGSSSLFPSLDTGGLSTSGMTSEEVEEQPEGEESE